MQRRIHGVFCEKSVLWWVIKFWFEVVIFRFSVLVHSPHIFYDRFSIFAIAIRRNPSLETRAGPCTGFSIHLSVHIQTLTNGSLKVRSNFIRWPVGCMTLCDDFEAICSILEDETNKNQLEDDFIVSLLKM